MALLGEIAEAPWEKRLHDEGIEVTGMIAGHDHPLVRVEVLQPMDGAAIVNSQDDPEGIPDAMAAYGDYGPFYVGTKKDYEEDRKSNV